MTVTAMGSAASPSVVPRTSGAKYLGSKGRAISVAARHAIRILEAYPRAI